MTHHRIALCLLACSTISGWFAARPLAAQQPKLRATLSGHTDVVYGAAFSPDGKTLATGSQDQSIKLWDAATGKGQATLQGHTSWVGCVAFSPSGNFLASAAVSTPGEVKLWDLATGKEHTVTVPGHSEMALALAYSPDGKTLASGGADRLVKLWDAATGQHLATLEGHENFGTVRPEPRSPASLAGRFRGRVECGAWTNHCLGLQRPHASSSQHCCGSWWQLDSAGSPSPFALCLP